KGHSLGSRIVFLATTLCCFFSSNLLPAEARERWGEDDIDQVMMNKVDTPQDLWINVWGHPPLLKTSQRSRCL
ncbi:hypothetical protein LEMLEM_LOCUS26962, partial [Lemmus lemmus]